MTSSHLGVSDVASALHGAEEKLNSSTELWLNDREGSKLPGSRSSIFLRYEQGQKKKYLSHNLEPEFIQ